MARVASLCISLFLIYLTASVTTTIDPCAVAAVKSYVVQLTALMNAPRTYDACWRNQVKQYLRSIAQEL